MDDDLHDLSQVVDLRDTDRPLPPPPPAPRRIDSARSFLATDPVNSLQEDTLEDAFEYTSFNSDATMPVEPAARLIEMIKLHGDATALKQLDDYITKFDMSGMPDDAAAKTLDISVQTYRRLRKDSRKRLARQIERLNVNDMLGQSLAQMEAMKQEMFKDTMARGAIPADKIKSTKMWLDLETSKYKFLGLTKFYDRRFFDPKEDEKFKPKKDLDELVDMLEVFCQGGEMEDTKYHNNLLESKFDDDDDFL